MKDVLHIFASIRRYWSTKVIFEDLKAGHTLGGIPDRHAWTGIPLKFASFYRVKNVKENGCSK